MTREDGAETSGIEHSGDMTGGVEANGEPSPRQVAEAVLISPDSTFQERYTAAQTYLDALAKASWLAGNARGMGSSSVCAATYNETYCRQCCVSYLRRGSRSSQIS